MTITISATAAIQNSAKISGWAKPVITRANTLGLLSNRLGQDYKQPITRLQFAELAVNFAENISGNCISKNQITFKDTTDTAVLKAAAAGIVKGTGIGTTFSPDSYITREEISTMIYRTITYVNKTTLKPPANLSDFCDAERISDWAKASMGSLVASGIMNGASSTELLPKDNTSIEQAISLIYRSYAQVAGTLTRPMAEQYADGQKTIQGDLQKEYVGQGKPVAAFEKSKVTRFELVDVCNDISGHPGTYLLFSLQYRLKPDHPENLSLLGGLDLDETNWMKVGLPTALVFKKELAGFTLVGGFITDIPPDVTEPTFRTDFERFLAESVS